MFSHLQKHLPTQTQCAEKLDETGCNSLSCPGQSPQLQHDFTHTHCDLIRSRLLAYWTTGTLSSELPLPPIHKPVRRYNKWGIKTCLVITPNGQALHSVLHLVTESKAISVAPFKKTVQGGNVAPLFWQAVLYKKSANMERRSIVVPPLSQQQR